MKVLVIIVTYNGKQWYKRCFDSLRASQIPVNVVVVDNSPTDETAGFIKENYPEIHCIKPAENLMFGQGNNIGIKYALENSADYVLLLNQDAWLIAEDTVSELVRISKENTEYGIISPVHLNKEENEIEKLLLRRFFDYQTTDKEIFNDLYFNRLKDIYETKYINAAAWFISRKTLEIVGGFDPFFLHYGEDDNYLNRLFYHGLKLGICPKLRIVHDNDRPRALYDSREEEVLLSIELTNVNQNYSYRKEILLSLQKTLTNLLKLRISRAKIWQRRLQFLWKNYEKLQISVNKNRQKALNWL